MRQTRFISLIALAVITFGLFGCKGKSSEEKKSAGVERLPHMDFSAQDSSAVRALADEYLSAFAGKDYNAAAEMLYKYEEGAVRPLNNEERNEFLSTMGQLPNFGVKLTGITMITDNNNRLQYKLQVTPDGDLSSDEGVMKFYLNPVLVDGQWYLTLLDMNQEGTRDIFQR